MCNKEIHELLIQESYVNCIFCNKQIQEPKRYFCCESMRLIKDGFIVCKNCGQVHGEYYAPEYFDFYGNRHRIRKKLRWPTTVTSNTNYSFVFDVSNLYLMWAICF